jgi:hypothetical protein
MKLANSFLEFIKPLAAGTGLIINVLGGMAEVLATVVGWVSKFGSITAPLLAFITVMGIKGFWKIAMGIVSTIKSVTSAVPAMVAAQKELLVSTQQTTQAILQQNAAAGMGNKGFILPSVWAGRTPAGPPKMHGPMTAGQSLSAAGMLGGKQLHSVLTFFGASQGKAYTQLSGLNNNIIKLSKGIGKYFGNMGMMMSYMQAAMSLPKVIEDWKNSNETTSKKLGKAAIEMAPAISTGVGALIGAVTPIGPIVGGMVGGAIGELIKWFQKEKTPDEKQKELTDSILAKNRQNALAGGISASNDVLYGAQFSNMAFNKLQIDLLQKQLDTLRSVNKSNTATANNTNDIAFQVRKPQQTQASQSQNQTGGGQGQV